MSEHWHQQLSKAAEGFGSVSVSRSYLRDALARIRELEAQQTAGEPVACRCGKCPALGLVDVDLSDKAHPRPRVGVTEAQQDEIEQAEGERIFDRVCEALNLDPNDGDCDSGDHADFIASAVRAHIERLTLSLPAPLANGGGEVADGR